MAESTATAKAQPWWVEPLMKYGVASMIGLYLVWWMTSVVAIQITSLETKVDAHTQETATIVNILRQNAIEDARYRRTFIEVSGLNCKFNARSTQEKALCDSAVQNWLAGR